MNNVVVTSEMRVGSRWMHYMLADMLRKGVSPEVDRMRLYRGGAEDIVNYLSLNRIPKLHRANYWDIETVFGENQLKVVAVVRNPRDRGVSLAFHNRYHKSHEFKQKEFDTDFDAIKYTVMEDTGFIRGNKHQLSLMIPECYVTKHSSFLKYVWVDYDYLLNNTLEIMLTINDVLKLGLSKEVISIVVTRHSFKNITNRSNGVEDKTNLYHRKGIAKDWANWFDEEMIDFTKKDNDTYYHYMALTE